MNSTKSMWDSRIGRRDFLKLMGITAASLGIAGCAPAAAPTATPKPAAPTPVPGPIHLDFIVWSYSVETILDNIKKFEAAYGNKIDVSLTDIAWGEYHEMMVARFTAKTPTDVCYNGGDWLPEFARAGWVVPLEDYFPQVLEYKPDIVGYALSDVTYKGKLYGLPYYSDITSFQYNKKLLKESGIAAPPETWEELTEQLKFLKDKGFDPPMALEIAVEMPTTFDNFTAMVYGRGGEWFDENFDPVFEDPAGPLGQQLQWMVDNYKAGLVTYLPHETEVQKQLNTGKTIYCVLWNYNIAALNSPDVSPLAGQYDVALMPGATHETQGMAKMYNMTKMAVDRGAEVMDACWKFIEYFAGKHEGQYKVAKRWAVEKGLGFGIMSLYDDPDVQKAFASFVSPDVLKQQAALARARRHPEWEGIFNEFALTQIVSAATGEISVEEAVKSMASKARELKAQYA
ncbi:MAG: extracellular solute-binding protein [Anaerolineae bacterium]|nr:extracellular solute-binding protein [Anaerolineae bacterium]